MLALEAIVLGHAAARRQVPALLGDALDMAAQLDLLGEQRVAGASVVLALVRVVRPVPGGELRRRLQFRFGHHARLLPA